MTFGSRVADTLRKKNIGVVTIEDMYFNSDTYEIDSYKLSEDRNIFKIKSGICVNYDICTLGSLLEKQLIYVVSSQKAQT